MCGPVPSSQSRSCLHCVGWMSRLPRSPGANVAGLVIEGWLAADRAAGEDDFVILADLPVGGGDDMAGGGVDAEETGDLGEHPRFLQRLADRALRRGLAHLLLAHRDGHCPVSRRRCSRIRPTPSVARTPAAGTRLLGLGALASLRYSVRPI